jgi:hypothetical protein
MSLGAGCDYAGRSGRAYTRRLFLANSYEGAFCAGGTAMMTKRHKLEAGSLANRVGRKLKSANKLLTGHPATIDNNHHVETVCD